VVKSSVARRYARALFELLDPGSVASARTGLTGLGEAYAGSTEFRHVLRSPAFGFEQKHAVLSEFSRKLGSPQVVIGFLAQVVKKNRVALLPDIADAFAALADAAKGIQPVAVSSAKPLTQAEQDGLRQRLHDLLRHEVDVKFEQDASLLAGLQIRIGSKLVDSTVRSRLAALKSRLTAE
jgi:F-type H+-transporting ATPase subunit delta